MRALIISSVFPPEPVVSAQTSAQVADELAARGHSVTVITAFPNRPAGVLYPGYVRRPFRKERSAAGYPVIRCSTLLSRESRLLSRLGENLSFGLSSGLAALATARPDVIYANTWPIFAAGILALIARWRHVPLVISVQDVYPESLIAQGRLSPSSPLIALLRKTDRAIAHSSHKVIVISERFAQIYLGDRQVPAQKVHVVPNWVDEQQIVPDKGGAELRAEVGISDSAFLLAYGGTIGVAANVESIIEALGCLSGREQPHLLIAGSGPNLSACQSLATIIAPDRVSFYTPLPAEKASSVYAAADVLALPTQSEQSLVSMPSKLIGYMLSARPIIAQAVPGSDLAAVIREAGCGWVVAPNQPDRLAQAFREAMNLSVADLRRLGQLGREYALRHFTRATCLPRIIAILEESARSNGQ